MKRKLWLCGLGLVGTVGIAVLAVPRSPVEGSHIEFLGEGSAQDSYGFIPFKGGAIVRAQMIDLNDRKFADVVADVERHVPGWSRKPYVPMQMKALRVSNGIMFEGPAAHQCVTIEEKRVGVRTIIEVFKGEPTGLRENLAARFHEVGGTAGRVYFLRDPKPPYVAID